MRTTLDIDDEVLAAAKEIARKQRLTAGKVISNLARQALTTGSSAANDVSEPPAVYGFRPFPQRGHVITDTDVERLRDEESI